MNYCVLLVGSVNERIIFSFVMNDQYRLASFLLIIVNAAKIKEQEEEAYEQQASHLTAYKYTTRDYKHIRNSKITKLVVYKMCFVVFNLWLSTYLNLLSFRWVISFFFYNESRHNMLIREWHHFCTVSFWLHWPPTSINALSHRYSLSLSLTVPPTFPSCHFQEMNIEVLRSIGKFFELFTEFRCCTVE